MRCPSPDLTYRPQPDEPRSDHTNRRSRATPVHVGRHGYGHGMPRPYAEVAPCSRLPSCFPVQSPGPARGSAAIAVRRWLRQMRARKSATQSELINTLLAEEEERLRSDSGGEFGERLSRLMSERRRRRCGAMRARSRPLRGVAAADQRVVYRLDQLCDVDLTRGALHCRAGARWLIAERDADAGDQLIN
jgi:hypothetical protein